MTDLSGDCFVTLQTIVPGSEHITASVVGEGAGSSDGDLTLTVTGDWNVGLGNGAFVTVTTTATDVVVDNNGTTTSAPIADVSSLNVSASGNSMGSNFTLHDIQSNFTKPITVTGGNGNDDYMLGAGFGQVTLHGDAPDKLDFSSDTTDTVMHPSDGTFSAGASDLTVDGTAPSSIDLFIADAASLISDVNSALAKISQVVDTVDSANAALSSVLPFLGASGTPSLDRLTNLISSFSAAVTAVQAKLATISTSSVSLGTVITKITSALGTLSATNALGTFTVSTRYSTSSTGVFVYLTLDQTQPDATTCLTSPTNGCLVTSIPLDLGPTLTGLGISLDADAMTPGAQAPMFSVAATLGGHLGIGFDSSSPSSGVFIDPTGQIGLGVAASLSSATVTINLGLLQASASLNGLGPLTGTASLALPGGSTPIALSSFSADDVTPSFNAQLAHSLFTIDLSVAPGVQVGGTDLSAVSAHVKLLVSVGDSTDFVDHPNTVSLFGDNGQTPAIHVEAHTSLGGGSNLLDSLDPSSAVVRQRRSRTRSSGC